MLIRTKRKAETDWLGWVGAVLLCAAPPLIDSTLGKLLAVGGLALLTVTAMRAGVRSIVACNIVGIIGYVWAILS